MKPKKYIILILLLFFTVALTMIGTGGNIFAYDLYATGGDYSDEFYGVNSSDASPTWLFSLPEGC
jgi:hypothetical protein